ncbi:MAG: hypothetical protein EOO27_49565 [Comamonadaceae bacterium]|nr:MAG: hypothetical protein EOO27_49565 [Comamonadaceae bacterium]
MKRTSTIPGGSAIDPGPSARALVVAVPAAANTHRDEIVRLMIDHVISEMAEVAADQRLVELLAVGADASVTANVQILEHDIDVKWMTAPGLSGSSPGSSLTSDFLSLSWSRTLD